MSSNIATSKSAASWEASPAWTHHYVPCARWYGAAVLLDLQASGFAECYQVEHLLHSDLWLTSAVKKDFEEIVDNDMQAVQQGKEPA